MESNYFKYVSEYMRLTERADDIGLCIQRSQSFDRTTAKSCIELSICEQTRHGKRLLITERFEDHSSVTLYTRVIEWLRSQLIAYTSWQGVA